VRGAVPLDDPMVGLATFDDPHPGSDDAVIEVKASGLCRSDLRFCRGDRETALANLGVKNAAGTAAEMGRGSSLDRSRAGSWPPSARKSTRGVSAWGTASWSTITRGVGSAIRAIRLPSSDGARSAYPPCSWPPRWVRRRLRSTWRVLGCSERVHSVSLTLSTAARPIRCQRSASSPELRQGRHPRARCFGRSVCSPGRGRSASQLGTVGFVGEGGGVTLDISPDVIRKQLTIIGSYRLAVSDRYWRASSSRPEDAALDP
jgi:hypothetical protein